MSLQNVDFQQLSNVKFGISFFHHFSPIFYVFQKQDDFDKPIFENTFFCFGLIFAFVILHNKLIYLNFENYPLLLGMWIRVQTWK